MTLTASAMSVLQCFIYSYIVTMSDEFLNKIYSIFFQKINLLKIIRSQYLDPRRAGLETKTGLYTSWLIDHEGLWGKASCLSDRQRVSCGARSFCQFWWGIELLGITDWPLGRKLLLICGGEPVEICKGLEGMNGKFVMLTHFSGIQF